MIFLEYVEGIPLIPIFWFGSEPHTKRNIPTLEVFREQDC